MCHVCANDPLMAVMLAVADHQRTVFGEDPPTTNQDLRLADRLEEARRGRIAASKSQEEKP